MKKVKLLCLVAVICILGFCGCNTSDNEALQKQVEELQKQNTEMSNKLNEMEQQAAELTLTPAIAATSVPAIPSPVPTSTPTPTSTPVPTSTPTPTSTPVPTSTPTPTSTPVPTSTPTPTNTPTPTVTYDMLKEAIKIYGTYIKVNSADGVSTYIQWENLSKKDIKYIKFNVELYNRVDDRISCDITGDKDKWLSQTGPIPQGKGMYYFLSGNRRVGYTRLFQPDVPYDEYQIDEKNGWEGKYWDCVWYNSTAHYVKVVGVCIEYMDGSTLFVNNKDLFEKMEIVNFKIGESRAGYGYKYTTSAKLETEKLPFSNSNIFVESFVVDNVKAVNSCEALFECRIKGMVYKDNLTVSIEVFDENGNRIDSVWVEDLQRENDGSFISSEFFVRTPIDGTYYLVIDRAY